ncbi:MAG: hypothetical protein HC845_10615 [Akkermansiaceae bacterium]|nr:hypothetical protein [Akkermansiaceae bacterium]
MSLVACTRDLASGLTTIIGSHIVIEKGGGRLENFDWLGVIAIGASIFSVWVFRQVKARE